MAEQVFQFNEVLVIHISLHSLQKFEDKGYNKS